MSKAEDILIGVLKQILRNQIHLLSLGHIGATDETAEHLKRKTLNLLGLIEDYDTNVNHKD